MISILLAMMAYVNQPKTYPLPVEEIQVETPESTINKEDKIHLQSQKQVKAVIEIEPKRIEDNSILEKEYGLIDTDCTENCTGWINLNPRQRGRGWINLNPR